MESYDHVFYEEMSKSSNSSARFLVPFLQKKLSFNSVIDLGCGDGQFVNEFIRNGISYVKGIEGEWILCLLNKEDCSWLQIEDLSNELDFDTRYDLAICLEVAEHLEEQHADTLIRNLTRASDVVFFSAAIPGQGGTNHINLQDPDYWARKFAEQGYFLEWDPRKLLWGNKKVAPWYQQNCLLYKKYEDSNKEIIIPDKLKHPDIFPELQSFIHRVLRLTTRIRKKFFHILSDRV